MVSYRKEHNPFAKYRFCNTQTRGILVIIALQLTTFRLATIHCNYEQIVKKGTQPLAFNIFLPIYPLFITNFANYLSAPSCAYIFHLFRGKSKA